MAQKGGAWPRAALWRALPRVRPRADSALAPRPGRQRALSWPHAKFGHASALPMHGHAQRPHLHQTLLHVL
eukprot:1281893-Pyramimonas_sp.AAC.1